MLIRTTIAVALVFAFSPLREEATGPHVDPTATATIATPSGAGSLPQDPRPRSGLAERTPESIEEILGVSAEGAGRALDVWNSLSDEARADLARLVARELEATVSR